MLKHGHELEFADEGGGWDEMRRDEEEERSSTPE